MANTLLRLGKVDSGRLPEDRKAYLALFHNTDNLKNQTSFRDESLGKWRTFQEIQGEPVKILQQFLKDAGFFPKTTIDGIFGYGTQAAVRLFQEYVRSIEGDPSIGVPDGIVGKGTWSHIDRWKANDLKSEWDSFSNEKGSDEYQLWLSLIQKAKSHFSENPRMILSLVDKFPISCDTRKIQDWDTSPETVHLIGIRRGQEATAQKRENDDLFILLIHGMVFKFWGSTDPSQGMASRPDEPFLIEGQHLYKFGWHKIGNFKKIYQALKPFNKGVLVIRDKNDDNALTAEDLNLGIDPHPNTTINIHWSGIGKTNFSAGCQVIAAQSYMNHQGEIIDCSHFASTSYADLGKTPNGTKTKGAYNILADLILTYAPVGANTVCYTIAKDDTLQLAEVWDQDFIGNIVEELKDGAG